MTSVLLRTSTIKNLLALLLLVVFAYSITPKIVLHNLVANHIDKGKVLNGHLDELSASGFNCKCDNLVAESPFVPAEIFSYQVYTTYISALCTEDITFSSFDKLFSQLRGPPIS
jgi:hypothetical protein